MALIVMYACGVAALYVFLRCLLAFTHDIREPVALATDFPFVSPLLGMRKKAKFYIDLRYVVRDLKLTTMLNHT